MFQFHKLVSACCQNCDGLHIKNLLYLTRCTDRHTQHKPTLFDNNLLPISCSGVICKDLTNVQYTNMTVPIS